jgi:hypothetical protein
VKGWRVPEVHAPVGTRAQLGAPEQVLHLINLVEGVAINNNRGPSSNGTAALDRELLARGGNWVDRPAKREANFHLHRARWNHA